MHNESKKRKAVNDMGFFLLIATVLVIIGLCIPDKKAKKAYFGALAAIAYFPIGVIMGLAKNYK